MPFRRRYNRISLLLYPLSPTTRRGRSFGRPGPARFTPPPSMIASKAVVSCRCPGVSVMTIGLPFPSARIWTLVLNPPRLLPNASVSGSPFLHPQRAGVLARWCRPHNAFPNSVGLRHRPPLGQPQKPGPRYLPSANDRIDSPPSTRNHIAREGLSMGRPSAISTVCRSVYGGDLLTVVPFSVSAVEAAVPAAPTVCQLSLLCSCHQFTGTSGTLQTRPSVSVGDTISL